MKTNISKLDRLIRVTLGGAMMLAVFQGSVLGYMATVVSIGAAILFISAIIGYCPLYSLLGIKTLDK